MSALYSLCRRRSAGALLPHRVHGLGLRYAGVVAVADGVHGVKGHVEEEDSKVAEALTAGVAPARAWAVDVGCTTEGSARRWFSNNPAWVCASVAYH